MLNSSVPRPQPNLPILTDFLSARGIHPAPAGYRAAPQQRIPAPAGSSLRPRVSELGLNSRHLLHSPSRILCHWNKGQTCSPNQTWTWSRYTRRPWTIFQESLVTLTASYFFQPLFPSLNIEKAISKHLEVVEKLWSFLITLMIFIIWSIIAIDFECWYRKIMNGNSPAKEYYYYRKERKPNWDSYLVSIPSKNRQT